MKVWRGHHDFTALGETNSSDATGGKGPRQFPMPLCGQQNQHALTISRIGAVVTTLVAMYLYGADFSGGLDRGYICFVSFMQRQIISE